MSRRGRKRVILAGGIVAIAAAVFVGSTILRELPSREELLGLRETPELEETLSPEVMERLNERYGLEPPAPAPTPSYLELLLQGDWGVSLKTGR